MESFRGQLLVAPPHLSDPNFGRSVVLLIQHDAQGAFGLVLNRPSTRSLADVWRRASELGGHAEARVHLGGPVPGPLLALHADPWRADAEIVSGVYCSTRPDSIETLLREEGAPLRFFAGYAGWGGGQLEGELQTGSWLTTPASADLVFDGRLHRMWKRVFQGIVDASTLPGLWPGDDDEPAMN